MLEFGSVRNVGFVFDYWVGLAICSISNVCMDDFGLRTICGFVGC